ncbi:unnamed protein product [Meloidogyne enterolobii]|uniref:Uncharacterized protein n=1 Tax=Meloidogyne enterolobii TaxID=390850 RepID=A0ACB1AFY2_MELEN
MSGMLGPVIWDTFRTIAAICTLGLSSVDDGGLKAFTHEAVLFAVHCRNCGRTMALTCELSTSGKYIRWGGYLLYTKDRKSREFNPHMPYNKIKKVFDGMWEEYNLISANCMHWARDFYGRICD